jgi:hypothetical protein
LNQTTESSTEGAPMKKIIAISGLLALLTGCSWFHHTNSEWGNSADSASGNDYGPGRGTTGVSSGADAGLGITGSDAAPPR